MTMAPLPPPAPPKPLEAGQVLDGFRLEERLHQGGMANLWRVSRVDGGDDGSTGLLMKVPRIKGGEDPATIVGFEDAGDRAFLPNHSDQTVSFTLKVDETAGQLDTIWTSLLTKVIYKWRLKSDEDSGVAKQLDVEH